MANTDRAGTMKRSRGDSFNEPNPKPTKKQKRKIKKGGKKDSNTKETKVVKHQEKNTSVTKTVPVVEHVEETATPEGLEMARVLSTLSPLEQSRFEAFRRSSVPSHAIRDYLAHLLLLHQEQCMTTTQTSMGILGANGLGMGIPHLEQVLLRQAQHQQLRKSQRLTCRNLNNHLRPLQDLVQPGDADSIMVVVSALAKAYAQRLVAAARRVADTMSQDKSHIEKHKNGVDNSDLRRADTNGTQKPMRTDSHQQEPLQVHHIQLAHSARVQAGLDPGFFLQRPVLSECRRGMEAPSASWSSSYPGRIAAAALKCTDRHELLRKAALQAQTEYDAYVDGGAPKQLKDRDEDSVDNVPLRGDESLNNAAVLSESIETKQVEPLDSSTNAPLIKKGIKLGKDNEVAVSSPPEKADALHFSNEPSFVLPSDTTSLSISPAEVAELATVENPAVDLTKNEGEPSLSVTIRHIKPVAPRVPKSQPMSMEEALFQDMDDDSDDSDDE